MEKNEKHSPKGRLKKAVYSIINISVGVYVGFLVLVYVFQTRLIFFPTTEFTVSPATFQWAYEDVTLQVGDETTHGWFIPAPAASRGTILFSHGNAGNISDRIDTIDIFRGLGFDTLIYDYGGYGKSSGSPSEQRCYEDIRAMWGYLTVTRSIPPKRIILFGRSLGGGATAQLATEVTPALVVLESSFASVSKMAHKQFPFFPTELLVRHRFDNIHKVPLITVPTLHIHSPDDSIIPYEQGRQLFDAAKGPKAFIELEGDHNEGFWLMGKRYSEGLLDFFNTHLQVTSTDESAPKDDSSG